MKKKWIFLALGIFVVMIFGGAYYQTKIYFQKKGNELVISNQGKVSVKSGGVVNFENGSKLQMNGKEINIDVSKIALYEKTVDFTAIDTGPCLSDATFVCTGVSTDDVVFINSAPIANNVAIVSAYVSSANNISVRLLNTANEIVNPDSAVLKIIAVRK